MVGTWGADDRASSGPGLDAERPLELEKSQRLAHGAARYTELLDHAMLGSELRSGPEAPTPDLADELAGDAGCGAFGISLSAHPLLAALWLALCLTTG
jgi:hypothetical protein